MMFEAWLQLRGEAPDDRQIATVGDRHLALTHNLGGYPGEMVSFVQHPRHRAGEPLSVSRKLGSLKPNKRDTVEVCRGEAAAVDLLHRRQRDLRDQLDGLGGACGRRACSAPNRRRSSSDGGDRPGRWGPPAATPSSPITSSGRGTTTTSRTARVVGQHALHLGGVHVVPAAG